MSIFGTSYKISGLFNCTTAYGEKCPAFPYDAMEPGSFLSNIVVGIFFLSNWRPVQTPWIPAPIIPTDEHILYADYL